MSGITLMFQTYKPSTTLATVWPRLDMPHRFHDHTGVTLENHHPFRERGLPKNLTCLHEVHNGDIRDCLQASDPVDIVWPLSSAVLGLLEETSHIVSCIQYHHPHAAPLSRPHRRHS
jgi:hypothetical protein